MDIELQLLSSLLETQDVKMVIQHKLTATFFYGRYKAIFSFILAHKKNYGVVPTVKTVQEKFVDFVPISISEPILYYIEKLRQRYEYNIVAQTITQAAENLKENNSKEALVALRKGISQYNVEVKLSRELNLLKAGPDIIRNYDEKKIIGIDGIKMGWHKLDNVTMGLHSEEYVLIAASTSIGKSWLACYIAYSIWKQSKVPVIFTKEMSPELFARRLSAIITQTKYEDIRHGTIASMQEIEWKERLIKELKSEVPFWIVGSSEVSTMLEIESYVEEYNPDVIIIDGIYLLEDEDSKNRDWRGDIGVSRAFKSMLQRTQKCGIATTQFNRKPGRNNRGSLGDIGYANLAPDADTVILLYQNNEMKEQKIMDLELKKHREGETATVTINWDFDIMNFSDNIDMSEHIIDF